MPVNMQNLQNLANITSLDQLKLGADNQLQQRSGIGTFFRRVGDAFLNLSQAGRASIAQRNERIVQAMQLAVNNARTTAQGEDQPMAMRLSNVLARIQTAAANMNNDTLDGLKRAIDDLQFKTTALKYGLHLNPAFDRLSVPAQKGLCYALNTIARNSYIPDKQAAMEQVKQSFFTAHPAEYDIDEGMRIFGENHIEEFLKPSQQGRINNGIHKSFILDANRHCIHSLNGADLPGGLTAEDYTNALRNAIPAQHHRFLPFISMMASQAGMDSAAALMPWQSKASTLADTHLMEAGIPPHKSNQKHALFLQLDGDRLSITDIFSTGFTTDQNTSDDAAPILFCKGQVTMNIDLAAAPRTETVDGKQVFIPQFTIENGEVHFETP